MEDPGNLTPRTAITEYYRSVTPHSTQAGGHLHRSYSHEDLAQRPRSNPRTRTPLRNPSPLMIGASVYTPKLVPENKTSPYCYDEDASLSSNSVIQSTPVQQSQRSSGLIVLGAAMPRGTLTSSAQRRMDARRSFDIRSSTQIAHLSKSRKGEPSHRKMRRWNNDRLQLSDFPPDVNITLFHNPDTNKREYIVPNAPRTHRGVFATLEPDIQDKVIHGEVVPLHNVTECIKTRTTDMGHVDTRLLSFITRACLSTHVQTVVNAFEQIFLVETQDMVQTVMKRLIQDEILYDMPQFSLKPSCEVRVVRFHFLDKPTVDPRMQEMTRKNKTPAFYRLILHTICQYHGWDVNSGLNGERRVLTVTSPEDKSTSITSILKVLLVP